MSKLRVIYILFLVILGLLVIFAILKPMTSGEEYTEVSWGSVIQLEDEWIIQIDLINKEGKITDYSISWSSGEQTNTDRVSIKDGAKFTYIYHVCPETVKDGQVKLEICKEGETTPFEEATYYVNFD